MRKFILSLKKAMQQSSLVFIGIALIWGLGEISSLAQAAEWATSGTNIYNTNTGNVGIRTTNPGMPLVIKSDGSANAIGFNDASNVQRGNIFVSSASWGLNAGTKLYLTSNGSGITIDTSGNVGIGTLNPGMPLVIKGDGSANAVGFNDASNVQRGSIIVSSASLGLNASTKLYLQSNSSGITIDTDGNVGIGTTNPSTKLNVIGDATFSGTVTGGNIQAKYQDIAEWVYSPVSVASGTVVVLDVQDINRVIPSSLSYDTRVAGVVSDTPGILLGEAGNGKVKVATTGRVKIKADATYRPIKVGDLLVTSDKEGYAMRSEPLDLGGIPIHRPGTILGKALESLSEGKGEILVLLTLQ